MTSLVAITKAIQEEMARRGVSAPFQLGPEHVNEHNAPPRIVWVPAATVYEPPMRIGGPEAQIHARLVRSEVHCWGKDYEQAEALADAVVRAAYRVMGGPDYDLGAGEWLGAALTNKGRVYSFEIGLRIPVTAEATKAATAVIERFVEET